MVFRARKPAASNRTIRMPDSLIEELGYLAKIEETSLNQIVVQCCEYALSELSPEQRKAVEEERRRATAEDKDIGK